MPCSVPNQIRPCRSRHPQRNLAGRDRRVADLQFPVVLEDAPSVGAAAPEKALPVGLQHQRTVVFRIFPEQCFPAGGVEEHHSRGSRADDLPPVADDMMQAAFGQQAFEIVVQRVVDADAAGSGDPERTLGVSADVVDAVGGERPRIVRLALVIIIGLSVVAAKSVVGRDPDVPDFVLRKVADRQVGEVLDGLRLCGDAPADAEQQHQEKHASGGRDGDGGG